MRVDESLKKKFFAQKMEQKRLKELAAAKSLAEAQAKEQALRQSSKRTFPKSTFDVDINRLEVWGRNLGYPPMRKASDWRPVGKAPATLTRSALTHLFCRYPVAGHFYEPWLEGDPNALLPHLGSGKSLYALVPKPGVPQFGPPAVPWPLTRKQCHILTTLTGMPDLQTAYRVAIAQDFGAPRAVQQMLMNTRVGALLAHNRAPFWYRVIQWLAGQGMFPADQLLPLLDFLDSRGDDYDLKGRTVDSLLKAMRDWHRDLNVSKVDLSARQVPYEIRHRPLEYEDPNFGRPLIYNILPVKNYGALIEEGRKMHHCVASYHPSILRGSTEIWSMSVLDAGLERTRLATIEVSVLDKRIVQFRGPCNAPAKDWHILNRWASINNLQVSEWL